MSHVALSHAFIQEEEERSYIYTGRNRAVQSRLRKVMLLVCAACHIIARIHPRRRRGGKYRNTHIHTLYLYTHRKGSIIFIYYYALKYSKPHKSSHFCVCFLIDFLFLFCCCCAYCHIRYVRLESSEFQNRLQLYNTQRHKSHRGGESAHPLSLSTHNHTIYICI